MDGTDRRVKSILDYWQLIVVLVGGMVAVVTFYNNVKDIVADQKAFRTTVDARRDEHKRELEEVRIRLAKLEQWKEDRGR